MIIVTGDTHGTIDYNKIIKLRNYNILNKEDYLIICGDFGAVWNSNTLERDLSYYTKLPFNILFVDGNHENFKLLNSFPVIKKFNGNVHKIKDNIYHLIRGEVYNIDGLTVLTFGGAISIDKHLRTNYISWWEEECPTISDLKNAIDNLKKVNNKVDYIITHTIDESGVDELSKATFIPFKKLEDNKILSWINDNVEYKHWYFGHYHFDLKINEKKTCLYNDFKVLDN